MKRIEFMLAVSAVVLASAIGAAAQSESLGDQARAVRKEKRPPAKKSYTNDNLPTAASISVVGPLAESSEEKLAAKPPEEKPKPEGQQNPVQKENKASENEKREPQDEQEWRDQIAGQNKKISDLEHELDLLQREYKLMVADYYADAGTQLRDQKKWTDEDAKYRADIAAKQKQVEEAKTQLQDMEEQARKAGMPSSVAE